MLTLEFVRAFIGEKMYARGMQEYAEANVFNMEITENDEHYKLITANVQGEEYYSVHLYDQIHHRCLSGSHHLHRYS